MSHERNVVQSPFGSVDIPEKNVTEYIFEGYEKYADKPAIVSKRKRANPATSMRFLTLFVF